MVAHHAQWAMGYGLNGSMGYGLPVLTVPCFVVPAAKLVIVSSNCPPVRKSEIEYYAMLSKTGVHHYTGSKWQSADLQNQQQLHGAVNTAAVAEGSYHAPYIVQSSEAHYHLLKSQQPMTACGVSI